jgi:hypothetical protein
MKKWTSHQARDKQLLDAEQINAELRDHQSSMTTLDRTQLPAASVDYDNLAAYALHRVYTVTLTPAQSPAEAGEQGIVDTDTSAYEFQCATYQTYGGGWRTLYTGTLNAFKGGNLYIECQGCGYVNPLCHQTANNSYPPNPKFIGIRIIVAGVNVAESMGSVSGGCESFRVMGTAQLPPGDHQVLVQWQGTAPGQDDIISNSGAHVMQFHIWSAKVLAIGRWR